MGISFGPIRISGFIAAIVSVPGAPTIGTATATGVSTANVTFTAPSYNGGDTITSYTAVSSPGGITGTISQAGSGTITVSGLSAGPSYTFTVYATNSAGNSASSAASNSITTATVPGAPTVGSTTMTSGTTATVAFTQPASNGGATITSYTATSSPGNITGTINQAGSGTITVSGLSVNTTYTFTVKATNSVGQGSASAASSMTAWYDSSRTIQTPAGYSQVTLTGTGGTGAYVPAEPDTRTYANYLNFFWGDPGYDYYTGIDEMRDGEPYAGYWNGHVVTAYYSGGSFSVTLSSSGPVFGAGSDYYDGGGIGAFVFGPATHQVQTGGSPGHDAYYTTGGTTVTSGPGSYYYTYAGGYGGAGTTATHDVPLDGSGTQSIYFGVAAGGSVIVQYHN
jgi:hypothetical protein